jgi:heme o synthase
MKAEDVEFGLFASAIGDHRTAVVMYLHHQFGGLFSAVSEQFLQYERHVRHQVNRIVPYNYDPRPVRLEEVAIDWLVDSRRHRGAHRPIVCLESGASAPFRRNCPPHRAPHQARADETANSVAPLRALKLSAMSVATGVRPAISSSWLAKLGAYVALTKPRIIELLLITTVPPMIVADRGLPSIWLILATVIGGTLSAGGANAINMWWDRDIDAVMHRTLARPLVRGSVTPAAALTFALALEAVSFLWLTVFVNLLAALVALAAALFYVGIYTMWLKRSSPNNIVIGGAAGAAPVLVGWAAVTDRVAFAPIVMFAIIFMWTPPHFWALAFKYREDYRRADVPMLTVVKPDAYTTTQILVYTWVLVALSLLLAPFANLGLVYVVAALVSGAAFLTFAYRLKANQDVKTAMTLFHWSISYLSVLFCAMAIDQFIHIA